MPSTWLVTYTMASEVSFDGGSPLNYPDLGLSLDVAGGLLKAIHHEFTLPDVPQEATALEYSRFQLEQFMAAIRYIHLKPIPYWSSAQRLAPPETSLRLSVRGSGVVGPRTLKTPPVGWQANTPPQLTSWLLLASEAQETPSSVSAIRFYYVVIEEFELLRLPLVHQRSAAIKDVKAIVA
jgi:hypothetical protein